MLRLQVEHDLYLMSGEHRVKFHHVTLAAPYRIDPTDFSHADDLIDAGYEQMNAYLERPQPLVAASRHARLLLGGRRSGGAGKPLDMAAGHSGLRYNRACGILNSKGSSGSRAERVANPPPTHRPDLGNASGGNHG